MALLGESPIWSYFKPAASNHPPSKRRKREHSATESAKNLGPEVKNSGKKGKKKATTVEKGTDSPQTSLLISDNLQVPKTPNGSSLRKTRDLQGFLPTPPTTDGGPSRRYKGPSPPLNCASTSSSLSATPDRKTLHSSTSSPYDDNNVTLNPSIDGQLNLAFDHVTEDAQSVPSSQTQSDLVHLLPKHTVHLSSLGTERSSPGLNSDTSNSTEKRDFVDDNDRHLIIQSSQSQLPLCIPDDAYRHSSITDTRKCSLESSISECIPSSQSQEIELSVPQETLDYGGSKLDWRQFSSHSSDRLMHSTTNPHLKRTFSDELFPVSVYEPFSTDIFRRENQPDPRSNSSLPDSYKVDDEDSVTESESEDGDKQLGDFPHELSRNTGKLPERDSPPPQEDAYDASQEDTTQGIDEPSQSYTGDPSILQQTPESQEHPFESLPPDLREVFGNSDDSFPPDFPMSLR